MSSSTTTAPSWPTRSIISERRKTQRIKAPFPGTGKGAFLFSVPCCNGRSRRARNGSLAERGLSPLAPPPGELSAELTEGVPPVTGGMSAQLTSEGEEKHLCFTAKQILPRAVGILRRRSLLRMTGWEARHDVRPRPCRGTETHADRRGDLRVA